MESLNDRLFDPSAFGDQLRQQLLDRIWIVILLIAVLGTPASVSRALLTGWLHLYTLHVLVGLVVVCLFLIRRKLSYRVRSMLLLAILFLIGAAGVLTLGVLGAGVWWLMMSSLLAGLLMSRKTGMVISVASLCVLVIAGLLFTTGVIAYPVDANRYVVAPASWLTFILAASLLPFLVFHSVSMYQESVRTLLQTVSNQRTELERLATHDQLTGLPLPNLAMDRLEVAIHAAVRSGKKVALLFIDLDGFKRVNDSLGHAAGDHVLIELSSRILQVLRGEDTAARIGGDEFILMLASVESDDEPALVARRIIEAFAQPILWSGNPLTIGASIGIALYPDHGKDSISLRRAADEAMYSVKSSGKNGFAFAKR